MPFLQFFGERVAQLCRPQWGGDLSWGAQLLIAHFGVAHACLFLAGKKFKFEYFCSNWYNFIKSKQRLYVIFFFGLLQRVLEGNDGRMGALGERLWSWQALRGTGAAHCHCKRAPSWRRFLFLEVMRPPLGAFRSYEAKFFLTNKIFEKSCKLWAFCATSHFISIFKHLQSVLQFNI